MKRSAKAVWQGGVRVGEGTVSTSSGVISNLIYTAGASSGEVPCITPSEMLAAAEASCIAVSVARELEMVHLPAEKIEANAEVLIAAVRKVPDIAEVHLDVTVRAPEPDTKEYEKAIHRAKNRCLITRNLKAKITMKAHVVATEAAVAHAS